MCINNRNDLGRLRPATIAGVVAALFAASSASGQSIDWWTVDGGGGFSNGGQYELTGTIGQPDAGVELVGGDYELRGGFWPGAAPLLGDVDGDGDVDAQDLALLLSSFLLSSGDPGFNPDADLDGNGIVEAQDLSLLLSNWGN